MGRFGKHLVPLLNIAPYNQTFVVFIKLIKVVGYFLTTCLNGEISLAECNNFFAGSPF